MKALAAGISRGSLYARIALLREDGTLLAKVQVGDVVLKPGEDMLDVSSRIVLIIEQAINHWRVGRNSL